MKSTSLVAASLLASGCYGSPLQILTDDVVRRQEPGPGSYFAITGATGGVHPRLEVRELEKTGEMWNLFLLAMKGFQEIDQNDIGSWYSVAGIHGMPWRSWDGVEGSVEGRGESQRGYCPHANLLFGTWHRPYLALFEQQLQKVAKDVAKQFPTSSRSKYEEAANKLRVPYWDWAKAVSTAQEVIPKTMTTPNIQVTFPNGTSAQIHNPLFEYRFNPSKPAEINGTGCSLVTGPGGARGSLPAVCNNLQNTVRRGDKTSNHVGLNEALYSMLKPFGSQRKLLYNILSQWQHFDMFSNNGHCGSGTGVGSVENLHDPIHVANFPGHMSPASVSAFDPMFWLHHANVDRQIALYQAVFPDTYTGPCSAASPTYTINTGDMLDAESPLTPFHRNAAGDFWTSTHARNIETMGYTYPELVNKPSNNTLKASIKSQYEDKNQTAAKTTKRQDESALTKGRVYLAGVKLALFAFADGEGSSQPYNVLVFLGDVPADPKGWSKADSFVGIASSLGGNNMVNERSTTVLVDLTTALAEQGVASDEAAAEYLKENLHWRLGLGDFELKREEIPGIEVNLLSTEVEFSNRDDEFDLWVGGYTEFGLVDA